MIDWSYIGFADSIIALGFAGFVGVTLLPLRSFVLMRKYANGWSSSVWSRSALILVAVAAAGVVVYGAPILVGLFHCLTDMRCGPNRAGGMISLALFGVGYLAFEVVALVANLLARRRGSAA
jgi:hypothetical protein